MTAKRTESSSSPAMIAAIDSLRTLVETMREDFNQKNQENTDSRHSLRAKVDDIGNRVSLAESTLRTIVGDNTGGSGLLHDMKRNQDQLKDGLNEAREEFRRGLAGVASDLREIRTTTASAPETRDWMNKWLGVGAAVALVGTVVGAAAGLIAILRYLQALTAHLPH